MLCDSKSIWLVTITNTDVDLDTSVKAFVSRYRAKKYFDKVKYDVFCNGEEYVYEGKENQGKIACYSLEDSPIYKCVRLFKAFE